MIDLLHKITEGGIALDIVDGQLKLYAKAKEVDPQLLAEIKENKEQILAYLLDTGALDKNTAVLQPIVPVAQAENYALSFGQQRLWTLSQFESGASTYNMPYHIELKGQYDLIYLKQAIRAVIDRHEILRTVFKTNEIGEVRQYIIPSEDFEFNVTYIDYRNASDKEQEVQDYITNDASKSFDLETGPLFRVGLLQTDDNRYTFYYNLHHIISDGWSMNILSQDVLHYYKAYANNAAVALEPLKIQYKDFANWQLEHLNSESSTLSKEYWAKELSGDLPVLDLPSEIVRPSVLSYEGRGYRTYFSRELSKRIKDFSTENGGSLFTGLLAAWNVLFHKYSGEQDILIGSPNAGRDHADVFNQIGFYVNTMVLRNTIDPEMTFRSLYKQVKDRTLESYKHQTYPFDRIIEDLNIQRNVGRNAIFDVLLVLQNAGIQISDADLENIEVSEIRELGVKAAKFDVELSFVEAGSYLAFDLTYNTAVYDEGSMKRMISHYQQLWEELLDNLDTPVTDISYISEKEEQQLLIDFNKTTAPYPDTLSIPEVFEKRVQESPDAVAVVYEDQSFTYLELDDLSNKFAQFIQDQYTIASNDTIGIKLERNHWFVVALLGVLKAGAVYVPMDPEFPKDVLDFITNDAACIFCITKEELQAFITCKKDIDISDFKLNQTADPLAYIMYTSGSTGKPKGVIINQKSILRLVMNTNYLDVTSHTVLGLSNFSFDGSTFDIFMPLLNGAKLVISEKNIFLDLQKFNELIITKNISCFFITTALFNVIVEAELPALGQIKCILFGGEQVSVKHVKRFKDLYPAVSLRHVYGPTENTTFSTFYEINAISDNPKTIPIGCSITNSTSYILDAKNKLVPIGVPGEICLGGEGIAEGYLNRPDLTETKFVPHPFIDGLSIYKTGDTGKWLSSGDIEFIGRKDDQIKIRGHRIELGEIENALLTIDAIDDAIVIARKNKNDEKEIVAYMVSGVTLSASDLRNELKKKLAIYMLPSYFVQLDQFVLNSNGKVNKKLLPDPETVCLSTTSDYVAPRNGKEELLVSIWTAVLQKTTVSVTDNFFELGGHSLKAARLIEEYRRAFNVKLTLETIFLHPILEDHVQLIEESTYSEYQSIPVMDSNDSYALSAGQKRLWALSQLETGASMYNMSFHTILEGSYDIAVLKQAIYATIKRHEILRTVFKIDDSLGELRQYIIPNDSFYLDIPFLNLQGEDGIEDKLAAYRKEDLHLPFDLTNGPLVRACLFQLEEAKYAFHYSMHHIIGDGWSMEVLSKDIFTFYESFKNNTTVSLQPLKIQYKEYANWQRLQLEEASSQQDKVFWKELLNGSLPVLDLPTQKLRPAVKTAQGRRFRTYLSAEQTTAIKGVTQEYGGSLFIALFSGWNILLHKYTAARDIIIGTPVAGRNHIDLLDQIGFYVNTIALRNEVNPELSFVSFYKKIKEQTLKSYNHQMYPFDQLIDDLDIRHQTSRNAVFDIMFSLQNVLSHRVDAIVSKDAVMAIEDTGEAIAKFDLEVNFQEVGQCLLFDVTYNTNVYEAETIEGLMNHYKQLWNVILEQPNELIQNLTYLSQEEEDQLVHTFNNNDIIYPEEDTIVTLFQQQAEKTPHNLAVVFGETQITYAQLDALSDKMANYIRNTNDVHPEDLIAVKLERSDWYVIALLAILKTGAAYVPIDLNYPEDRIAFIQSDSNCIATIDDSFISEFQNATIVSDSRDVMVQASNMAYVIYTSGSTGKPKGVMVEHKALSNLCHWHQKEYSLSTDSRCTLYASIGFDASTWELFPTLLSGGCVYPIPESIRLKTADLIAFFNTHKITQAFVPTVLYNDILRDSAALQQPLKLLLGGEALIVKDVNDKLEIYNNYGPTENAVVSTCYRVKKDTVGLVPIGKPIGNVKTYILDENGSLVPPGVTGELCLAGKSLARGYLNSPSLTGEKFVSHVLAGDGKLYKTGDLAKWLPDGNIQFMGRKDNQVKLRGYRIELGEIEAALQEISGIKETIVLVKEIKGEKYITAYMVGNTEIDRMILKKKLSRTLADYMIPTYFIYVDSMPLTANGKVDVKLLPDTDDIQFKEVAVYVSPESDLEKQLVTIWQDILEKDRIGIEDSFFALGGHSLKAIQVISKIQKEFNIKIELKELYNEPRIKNLASYIESIQILNSQQPVFMAVGEELVF
ncbi:non-ribosomal peptide synthetase [Flavobacterium lipolyticum]|uniref:Amino acid adenylation domain-containing protein n=1 Tax=Flavobacterium lipolyticum TaxID=2893754 RepID=A0ABS8M212_9FLAO|nr:non-ribosomal peptide synthetase [Flavobacterium sp. F-126]MCC9018867.1 amino acid adenylation domain-containing protein [Flavobacterium sp. F-126]